jgi:hypothetical protein
VHGPVLLWLQNQPEVSSQYAKGNSRKSPVAALTEYKRKVPLSAPPDRSNTDSAPKAFSVSLTLNTPLVPHADASRPFSTHAAAMTPATTTHVRKLAMTGI